MENVVVGAISMFFLVGAMFTVIGGMTGDDPMSWLEDKFDAAKRLLNR